MVTYLCLTCFNPVFRLFFFFGEDEAAWDIWGSPKNLRERTLSWIFLRPNLCPHDLPLSNQGTPLILSGPKGREQYKLMVTCVWLFSCGCVFLFSCSGRTFVCLQNKKSSSSLLSRLFILSVSLLPSCHLCRKPQVTFDLRLNKSLAVDPVLNWTWRRRSWPVSGSFSNMDA